MNANRIKAVLPMYFFPHRGQCVDSNDNPFPQNTHLITRVPLPAAKTTVQAFTRQYACFCFNRGRAIKKLLLAEFPRRHRGEEHPPSWKRMLVYITGSVNRELRQSH